MQSFEVERYETALREFEKAFWAAYREALSKFAAGELRSLPGVPSVFYVDLPRSNVLDGEWVRHTGAFGEAGLNAALATRRQGEPRLSPPGKPEDAEKTDRAFMMNEYRWTVVLS